MAFSGFLHRDPDYSSLPETVDEKLLEERVQALRSGNLDVAPEISHSLMRIVMGVVRDTFSNDDELIGEALLTLQESVIKASTALTDNNIIPYVVSCIRYRLKDVVLKNRNSYSISARRIREILAAGKELPKQNAISEGNVTENSSYEGVEDSHLREKSKSTKSWKNILDPRSGQAAYELRDQLEALVKSHRQKMVVELKAQDYTYSEIAKVMKISEATAMREVHDLRVRYESKV